MHTRKVGMNRGKPRIWLEGKELSYFGIRHGQRFNVYPQSFGLRIEIHIDGKRKIAGTPARPIIDMSGGTVSAGGFEAGDTFTIETDRGYPGINLVKVES